MINQLIPQRIDNAYSGRKLALWIFGLVVTIKTLQGVMVIFDGRSVLMSADGIPLDTYPAAAAQAVVAIGALFGVLRLAFGLLCILVLVRYRGLVAFMLGLLGLEYLARELVLQFVPLVRTGTPPGPIVNLVLFVLTVVGLALSLWRKDTGAGPRRVSEPMSN